MALALACAAGPAAGEPLQVFIFAGQSNMVGGARIDTDEFPADHPTVIPEVLYTQNVNRGEEPWGPLQAKEIREGQRRWFGPELSFGQALVEAGMDNVAIIKYARDGTSLAKDWRPEGGPCEGANCGPSLRPNFYSFVDAALAELTAMGHTYEVAGFVWVQGTADAGSLTNAQAYADNLNQFVGELEGRYGEMSTFINRYHSGANRVFIDELRQSQAAAANDDDTMYIAHADDLPLKSDNIHFTTTMQLELGRRLADRYIQSVSLQGDYNRDGVVDGADYAVWRNSLGSISDLRADGDGDGVVEADDLALWQSAFGSEQAPPAINAAPEPCAAALAVFCVLASCRRTQRSRTA